jgi:hypothetical protein
MWVEALRVELHHAHDHIIMPQSIEPNLDCFIEEGGWASLGRKEYHMWPNLGLEIQREGLVILTLPTHPEARKVLCVTMNIPSSTSLLVLMTTKTNSKDYETAFLSCSMMDLKGRIAVGWSPKGQDHQSSICGWLPGRTRAILTIHYEDFNADKISIFCSEAFRRHQDWRPTGATFGKWRRRLWRRQSQSMLNCQTRLSNGWITL